GLLGGGGVQLVPDVDTATGGPQPGDPQRRAEPVGQRREVVQLVDVVPGGHHRDLGVGEAGVGEVLQGAQGHVVGAGAADGVVDLRGGAVEGDLHVDVVAGRQFGGHLRGDPQPVGGELHPHVVRGGVVDQLPKIRPHSRFAATDVHIEHLHAFEFVDDVLA